ncbi:MDIS1-interacting receptor like kinase 2-like protein, partial [Tanacetum coccineum]
MLQIIALGIKALADWWGGSYGSDHCNYCFYGSGPRDLRILDFSSFPNLERFIIDRCHLEGSIPEQIGMLSNLAHLSLRGNKLNGTLPVSVTNLTKLVALDLSGNNFTSNIPSQIGNLKNLLHLNLSRNNFIDPIPSSLCSMVSLTYMDISRNNFIGSVPSSLGSVVNLTYLDLSWNNFTGPIPSSLSFLVNLTYLDLMSENNFSGHVPFISYFRPLRWNNFTGPIPSSLGSMFNLIYLDLCTNKLNGLIPEKLSNLQKLENRITGVVKTLKACTMLHYLDLSSNNFVGEALTYGDFFYLEFLNQSQNHFTNVRTPSQKLVHYLVIILPVIVASWFLFLGYGFYHRHKATNDNIEPETIKHGDVCAVLNYDGTIAYEDFISATEDFDLKYCIGTGGYGSVYEANLPSGKTFALKKLHRFEAKQPAFDQSFKNE